MLFPASTLTERVAPSVCPRASSHPADKAGCFVTVVWPGWHSAALLSTTAHVSVIVTLNRSDYTPESL